MKKTLGDVMDEQEIRRNKTHPKESFEIHEDITPIVQSKAEEDYQWNRSDIVAAEATKKECVIVRPKPNELFIDIDNENQLESFKKAIGVFIKTHLCTYEMIPSSSGKPNHFHIRVTLGGETVDARTRILYQAVLGSDPVREVLSLLRLERDDPMPTIFFEKANGRSCTCSQSAPNVIGDHHTLNCSMYEDRNGLQ
jgi:hypothetical protein